MHKYRKKPVVIEAIQFIVTKEIPCKYGTEKETNSSDIANFIGKAIHVRTAPSDNPEGRTYIEIPTLEGVMQANINDFIIKGVNNEFYPCKPDIFEKTYDLVE